MKWHILSLVFIAFIAQTSLAQPVRYATGFVVDAQRNLPLSGAHVLVLGANEGTVTDSNGLFTIELYPGEDTLVVRYPGFGTQQVPVKSDTMLIELLYEMGLDTIATVDPETYEETYQIVRYERD